ncbi:MAG: O-acetylhomoserine aminocarboxypropyltransferase/cysteine synthase [Eubacteriaceae bacterium]|nr:O-acetylhomoserine aminocarboxypropyltransferase/cysteine synthase [Eubacteriaceae bacterium]
MDPRKLRFETLQVHAGQESADQATGSRAVPIYMTTAYVFDNSAQAAARFDLVEDGNIYTRLMNPTTDIFEKRMAALEGGVGALATASGAAAVTYSVLNIAKASDHIVADISLYGGTYNLFLNTFKGYNIDVSFVDMSNTENLKNALRENTKAVYAESLGNPNSTIVDIEEISKIAHSHGIPVIIDNTFATPYMLRPFEYGVNISVHSASKFIGGHGTALGGVIVDGGNFDWKKSGKFPDISEPNPSYHGAIFTEVAGKAAFIAKARLVLMRDEGATLSPFNSFLFLQGLETLSLRLDKHVSNTLAIIEYLKKQPLVEKINHPSISTHRDNELYKKYFPTGGGSIFTIQIKGEKAKAQQFSDNLKLFSLLANVADTKSLVIHPASTTHSQMTEAELLESGITGTTVRLSIGIEHPDDIIADLDQAFESIK